MEESAGVVEVEVQVLADEYGNITDAGLPLGVRVTSKDGSAVGKTQWFYIDKHVQEHNAGTMLCIMGQKQANPTCCVV